MDRFQINTVRSFRKAKEDIKNLQAQITDLSRKIEEFVLSVENMKVMKSKNGLRTIRKR